jgi:hypothetical protein
MVAGIKSVVCGGCSPSRWAETGRGAQKGSLLHHRWLLLPHAGQSLLNPSSEFVLPGESNLEAACRWQESCHYEDKSCCGQESRCHQKTQCRSVNDPDFLFSSRPDHRRLAFSDSAASNWGAEAKQQGATNKSARLCEY